MTTGTISREMSLSNRSLTSDTKYHVSARKERRPYIWLPNYADSQTNMPVTVREYAERQPLYCVVARPDTRADKISTSGLETRVHRMKRMATTVNKHIEG